jgi:hypothetical protein|uniref:Uncharacterized protein n=1 Tax=viral metagenome TaxID=1070528 RepID=A0A6C0IW52_9ZZZZ
MSKKTKSIVEKYTTCRSIVRQSLKVLKKQIQEYGTTIPTTKKNQFLTEFLDRIKKHYKFTVMTKNIGKSPLIILHAPRNDTHQGNYFPIAGLVCDTDCFKIVSFGPPTCIRLQLKKDICAYKVFRKIDGVTFSMYYHNKKWQFSTIKTFDAGSMRMFGDTDFSELIKYEFSRHDVTFSDHLSKNKTYTFVLQHPDWNITTESSQLIFVQSVDRKTANIEFSADALPFQSRFKMGIKYDKEKMTRRCEYPPTHKSKHMGYIVYTTSGEVYMMRSQFDLFLNKTIYDNCSPGVTKKWLTLVNHLTHTNNEMFYSVFGWAGDVRKNITDGINAIIDMIFQSLNPDIKITIPSFVQDLYLKIEPELCPKTSKPHVGYTTLLSVGEKNVRALIGDQIRGLSDYWYVIYRYIFDETEPLY